MYMLTNKNNKLFSSFSLSQRDLEARISIFIIFYFEFNITKYFSSYDIKDHNLDMWFSFWVWLSIDDLYTEWKKTKQKAKESHLSSGSVIGYDLEIVGEPLELDTSMFNLFSLRVG